MALNKPFYRVPSMADIACLPWNGYTVASTFSGAGGSCTGYRMAGYRVIWANEFLPEAQDSYRRNHPDSYLNEQSIRDIQPDDVLTQAGIAQGELDIFDGSPPCQSFSTAGRRQHGWQREQDYGHGLKQRNDDLFWEYARLLKGIQPKVFIAENVSGLVKGKAKGYFKEILALLKACGYRVEARLLDAQWLGVPQMRQRIIFMGVRLDLDAAPAFPTPLPYRYSVRDALSAFVHAVEGNSSYQVRLQSPDGDHPAILTSPTKQAIHVEWDESRPGSKANITDDVSPTVRAGPAGTLMAIEGANGYNGHAFSSTDQPAATVQAGRPLAVGKPTAFSFQIAQSDKPSSTVLTPAGDIGHPTERRKLTIAELKRICSFPDDYILTGSYAQQWARLGNAVPPVMMSHIARTVQAEILDHLHNPPDSPSDRNEPPWLQASPPASVTSYAPMPTS